MGVNMSVKVIESDLFCKKCELTTTHIVVFFTDDGESVEICCICHTHATACALETKGLKN